MSKLKFGGRSSPSRPTRRYLAGQFAERISEYVEKPICVTAPRHQLRDRPGHLLRLRSGRHQLGDARCAQSSPGTTQVLTR